MEMSRYEVRNGSLFLLLLSTASVYNKLPHQPPHTLHLSCIQPTTTTKSWLDLSYHVLCLLCFM